MVMDITEGVINGIKISVIAGFGNFLIRLSKAGKNSTIRLDVFGYVLSEENIDKFEFINGKVYIPEFDLEISVESNGVLFKSGNETILLNAEIDPDDYLA